ncbi:MAG: hypothetical protein ACRCV9_02690, partial [Burkholderiaceae bacterium]
MNTPKRTLSHKFKSTLIITALAAAFLVGCGGTEDLEPPVTATAVATDTDLSVTLADKNSSTDKKWVSLKLDFAATVDTGPSKGTMLKGDLKLVSEKPAADGSADVKGVLVVGGDDKERPNLTDDQKKQIAALTSQFAKDVDAARKELADKVKALVDKFQEDRKAAANDSAALKALIDKFLADMNIAFKAFGDKVQTLADKLETDVNAITGGAGIGGGNCKAYKVEGKLAADGTLTLKFDLRNAVINGTGKKDAQGKYVGTFTGPQSGDSG